MRRTPARGFLCIPALAVALASACAAEADRSLEWPLAIDPALTSTFGEHRFGYFHSGIDLTTWGETGVPLTSVGDGFVHRVRASGVGYGRALYVKLDEGPMILYAHLDGFAPEIAAYVRAEQERLGRYEVDLRPEEGRFRIRKGELIAWTGESGAGPPHLHLEVRNGAGDVAINPLGLLESPISDGRRPRMISVSVVPASAATLIDGAPAPITHTLREESDGRYVADTTSVTGPVVIAAHVFDKAEGKELRLAIYALELYVDGELRYASVLDSIPYARQREVDLVYDAVKVADGQRRVRRLYRPRGSRIGLHGAADGRILPAPPGRTRTVRIVASDWFGNRSEARIVLATPPDPLADVLADDRAERPADEAPMEEPPHFEADLAHGVDHAVVTIKAPEPIASVEAAAVRGAEGGTPAHVVTAGEATAVVRFDPEALWGGLTLELGGRGREGRPFDASIPLPIHVVRPERGSTLEVAGARLVVETGVVYAPECLLLEPVVGGEVRADGLTRVSGGFRVGPPGVPLERSVRLAIAPEDTTGLRRIGVYVRHPRRPLWIYMGSEMEAGSVAADIRGTGVFCLIRDDAPPRVRSIRPRDGARITSRTPAVIARLSDVGSGLGWRDMSLELDGSPLIAEWDPESGSLRTTMETPLAKGRHVVRVTVTDQAGNRTVRQSSFTVIDE